MTRYVSFLCVGFLMLIGGARPVYAATTTCSYTFTTGSNNTFLSYCVTVNGNILEIVTPFGQSMLGANGEGYGICDQNAPMNYTDYGISDTGNWQAAVVLSHSSSAVKIARTTIDGNWTLTQNITKIPATSSIKLVMALKNNQAVSDVAYLVRFADAAPPLPSGSFAFWAGGLNSSLTRTVQAEPNPSYGLQLSTAGPVSTQFSFWHGYAQSVNTGPNACAFQFNELTDNYISDGFDVFSIEMAFVGTIGAGQTKTVTLSYRGL